MGILCSISLSDTPARVGMLSSLSLKAPLPSRAASRRFTKRCHRVQPKYQVWDSGRSAQEAKGKVQVLLGVRDSAPDSQEYPLSPVQSYCHQDLLRLSKLNMESLIYAQD
ncbi:hypothetical protein PIB30_024678 [Stylosanthes scabra]|uniref:Uncharacterized protein n=1 Tax=Stylosanthes scabra TaxID=79078 RepID=A0ABU6ZAA0_9FABA|nr:hypothetical protein [Stylosanthes scabra]